MVFLYHYGASFAGRIGAPQPIVNILSRGYLGVSLFFILSGFILTYSYMQRAQRTGWVYEFEVARFARIYPVYALALLIALPLSAPNLTFGDALRVLSMTQAWTTPSSDLGYAWIMQAWTLSIELVFYLLFPFLIGRVCRMRLRSVVASIAICWLVMFLFGTPSVTPYTPGFHSAVAELSVSSPIPIPAWRLFEFVLGMLMCRLMVSSRVSLQKYSGLAPTLTIIGLILFILAVGSGDRSLAIAMILTSVLLVLLALGDNAVVMALSSKVMVTLGGASYALYLLQWPVREYIRLLHRPALEQILNPVVALAVSLLVFHYWEGPLRIALIGAYRRLTRPAVEVRIT